MTSKKQTLEHFNRIALLIDGSSLLSQRLMSGACQRAAAYPHLSVRRYFIEPLVMDGIEALVDWKPDALMVNCSDAPLLQSLRKSLPQTPIIAMNSISFDLVDAIVKGNANEAISLSLDHFADNNLPNMAMFYAGTAGSGIQADIFSQLMGGHPGTFSFFHHEVALEDLLSNPNGESLEQISKWLKDLPKPVGIYSPTSHSAAYLVRICEILGLGIPEEIQVIGCDELDESLECIPHLTSIRLPSERIGAAALKTAIRLLQGKNPASKTQIVDGATLVPQGSTGIIPSHLSDIPAAIAYIESHTTQGLTVEDVLSQTQSVSRMTFYREFKEQIGDSPAHYMRRCRIETACRLLSTTELDIFLVAEQSGFLNSNYFSQVFRRDVGMTPLQYRSGKR